MSAFKENVLKEVPIRHLVLINQLINVENEEQRRLIAKNIPGKDILEVLGMLPSGVVAFNPIRKHLKDALFENHALLWHETNKPFKNLRLSGMDSFEKFQRMIGHLASSTPPTSSKEMIDFVRKARASIPVNEDIERANALMQIYYLHGVDETKPFSRKEMTEAMLNHQGLSTLYNISLA